MNYFLHKISVYNIIYNNNLHFVFVSKLVYIIGCFNILLILIRKSVLNNLKSALSKIKLKLN